MIASKIMLFIGVQGHLDYSYISFMRNKEIISAGTSQHAFLTEVLWKVFWLIEFPWINMWKIMASVTKDLLFKILFIDLFLTTVLCQKWTHQLQQFTKHKILLILYWDSSVLKCPQAAVICFSTSLFFLFIDKSISKEGNVDICVWFDMLKYSQFFKYLLKLLAWSYSPS